MNEYATLGPIGEEIRRVFGDDGLHWSCLGRQGEARLTWCVQYLLLGKAEFQHRRPVLLEIGTHHGVSSTIIAALGVDVVTLDIREYPLARRVWAHFGVEGGIIPLITEGDHHTAQIAKEIHFDAAFIDGCHALASVRANFEAVKQCGRVIFHDYEHRLYRERTVAFVDALPYGRTTKLSPFAVWESPEIAGVPWGVEDTR